MNIERRIEKLEKDSNINSIFCTCPGEIRTRVILPDLDKTEEERILEQAEMMKPKYCDQCRKLIEHRYIIIEPVPSEID